MSNRNGCCGSVRRVRPALWVFIGISLTVGVLPATLEGQSSSREALLQEARVEFDNDRAIELLLRAADPSLAPPDSIWAVSIHELAFALVRADDTESAELWLRWAARHASSWPLDASWFPPVMAELWDQARQGLGSPADEPSELGSFTWDWAGAAGAGVPGRLDVGRDVPADASVVLAGPSGEVSLSPSDLRGRWLDPGTYALRISAREIEESSREIDVLPGIVTQMDVQMTPVFTDEARVVAEGLLARIQWEAGVSGCTNGVITGSGRAVVTTLTGLGVRDGLSVTLASGESYTGLALTALDEMRNLAVLRLPGEALEGSAMSPSESDRFAWALHHSGCADTQADWTRIPVRASGGSSALDLVPWLPSRAAGAPLVSSSGGLVGIVMAENRAIGLSADDPLIRTALAPPVVQMPDPPAIDRGGLPWRWIGAGVAIAGVGAVLAGGGGGGAGGDTGTPGTGTIVSTFPGGGP